MPVLGFNNNVRHRGRLFHIQTEDSGVKFSRIVTHLFADGGRIIKTSRIDYVEHVEKEDVATIVRTLMKEQHRAMFTALRAGELDVVLEKAIGPLPEPPVAVASQASGAPSLSPALTPPPAVLAVPPAPETPASTRRRDSTRPSRPASERPKRRPITNPNLRGVSPSVAPPAPEAFDLDVATLDRLPPQPPRPSPRKTKSRPPAPNAAARVATAPQRPATQLSNPPGTAARSIFGDGAVSEQTLDEVILSYLAEDLDGSGEK
ncbi:MAG TPA: hypothetical protein VFZ53_00680 [Polyangiaceae bacterium]